MSASENHSPAAETAKTPVAARIERKLAKQEKTLTGAFMLSLVIGGIAALALVVTWMSNAAHQH
jgi:hypothetical protein